MRINYDHKSKQKCKYHLIIHIKFCVIIKIVPIVINICALMYNFLR